MFLILSLVYIPEYLCSVYTSNAIINRTLHCSVLTICFPFPDALKRCVHLFIIKKYNQKT